MEEEDFEESLSYRRQRNKKAEEELHHISEKLSHRLEELDQVCGLCILILPVCLFYSGWVKACNNVQCVIPIDA